MDLPAVAAIANSIAQLLREPAAWAVMGALLGGLLAMGIAQARQVKQASIFPVLFSGITRLREPPVGALYYAALNDMVMSVTDAWNATAEGELLAGMRDRMKAGPLRRHAAAVLHEGPRLLDELREYRSLWDEARKVAGLLDSVWSYKKRDNYRTEYYTESYTDSQGRRRTRRRSRRVYDNTDHWFTYYPERAEHALSVLDALLERFGGDLYRPGLDALAIEPAQGDGSEAGPYRAAGKVDKQAGRYSEAEYVKRTILEDEEAEVTREDIRDHLNVWLRAAHAEATTERVRITLEQLRGSEPRHAQRIKSSRGHYHFRTGSRSHSGPDGYEAAALLERDAALIASDLHQLLASFDRNQARAEELLAVTKGELPPGWRSKPSAFANEALDHAVDAYLDGFPDSTIHMDQRIRTGPTLIAGAVGLVLGGLLGLLGFSLWIGPPF